MTTIEVLTQFSELKFNYLQHLAKTKSHETVFRYDKEYDALLLLFAPDDKEFVAHYVDGNVALLYYADSYEVMGLQIEDFASTFVPQHRNVMRVWQLRASGEDISNFGDIVIVAQKLEKRLETLKPEMIKEVAEAAKSQLTEPIAELVAALA